MRLGDVCSGVKLNSLGLSTNMLLGDKSGKSGFGPEPQQKMLANT
jgi:hypothetical protein